MKSPIKIRIFGQDYLIRSREGEEYVLAAAKLVDEKMRQVAEKTPSAGTLNVAVLAALNLAGDFLKAQRRSKELASLIEENLKN